MRQRDLNQPREPHAPEFVYACFRSTSVLTCWLRATCADGMSRCAAHPKPVWQHKPTATKRITGRKLQAMRAKLFAVNTLCVICKELGKVALATQRDHVEPLAEGGAGSN